MTKKELEQTEWATRVKHSASPYVYKQAIKRALLLDKKGGAIIYKSNELKRPLWAVSDNEEFWFEAYSYKKEAINLCKEMGWRYTIV